MHNLQRVNFDEVLDSLQASVLTLVLTFVMTLVLALVCCCGGLVWLLCGKVLDLSLLGVTAVLEELLFDVFVHVVSIGQFGLHPVLLLLLNPSHLVDMLPCIVLHQLKINGSSDFLPHLLMVSVLLECLTRDLLDLLSRILRLEMKMTRLSGMHG